MTERQADLEDFLRAVSWQDARREPLLGDASARRYTRLVSPDGTRCAMLMDAPPGNGLRTGAFIDVGRWLFGNGLSAPEIIEADRQSGFVLMEDLGDALFSKICVPIPDQEKNLYAHAVDVLTALRSLPPFAILPPYSTEVYVAEANLLLDWYVPAASGTTVSEVLRATFARTMQEVCANLPNDRTCPVLRDYHADNLIWLPERSGLGRVGLLDFQDALLGHPAYDLVSLLKDARRDVGQGLQKAMIERYLASYCGDHEAFLRSYATLGAQRNLKIIGIFTRLCRRDSKPAYVNMIPRVWRHLQSDLSHPALASLRAFVNRHVPEPGTAVLDNIRRGTP